MDYKFVLTLAINVVGLAFMGWQVRLMLRQLQRMPIDNPGKKAAFERRLSKRLYKPILFMAGLILLSWLPFVLRAYQPSPLPPFIISWGGALDGCAAAIDTSSFVKAADKYKMYLVCHITDPTLDPMEDERIAVSKPFLITGGIVPILITYGESDPIKKVAKLGTQTLLNVVLLPKEKDGTSIKKLSDISREGGQILLPGGVLRN